MAKGRKLIISRSERFLGNIYDYSQQTSQEFTEQDVWSNPIADEIVNHDDDHESTDEEITISRDEGHVAVGGLSLAFHQNDDASRQKKIREYNYNDLPRGRQMATSAPVSVPSWGKLNRVDSDESLPDSDDDNQKMVPPHEYLAREYGCSRNSVFEGVGRTLKGRDLRRVRDAVWSQTGFDG